MVDHKVSEGARLERKAFREYLRREIRRQQAETWCDAFKFVLKWVLARQERYDARPGGLGRK